MIAGLIEEEGGVGKAPHRERGLGTAEAEEGESFFAKASSQSPAPKSVPPTAFGHREGTAGGRNAGGARLLGHRLNYKQRCRSVRQKRTASLTFEGNPPRDKMEGE